MDDLGKYLKTERKKQKISVDEIASHTKIPIRFIQAIETNQFDQIPNPVSAKGFLRSYAQFLGLDTAEIAETFDRQVSPMNKGASSPEKQDEILSYLQVKRSPRLPFPRRVVALVGGVVFLLLIFVGLLPERKDTQRTPSPPPLPVEEMTTMEGKAVEDEVFSDEEIPLTETPAVGGEITSAPIEEAIIEETAKKTSKKADSTVKVSLKKKEKIVSPLENDIEDKSKNKVSSVTLSEEPSMHLLYVEALEPTWVQVEIDGDEVREALLQPNDSVRWKAKEKFLLKVGNAGGVKVRLNGKDLEPLGPSGKVVEKEIIGTPEKTE